MLHGNSCSNAHVPTAGRVPASIAEPTHNKPTARPVRMLTVSVDQRVFLEVCSEYGYDRHPIDQALEPSSGVQSCPGYGTGKGGVVLVLLRDALVYACHVHGMLVVQLSQHEEAYVLLVPPACFQRVLIC